MKVRSAFFVSILFVVAALAQSTGKPQYGAWGFDTEGADLKTKPGDDFFRYASGTWLDHTEIPADKGAYSLRLAMTDLTEQRLHELMEQAATTAAHAPAEVTGKVGAFYKSFMAESHLAELGARPLEPELAAVRAATTREKIAALMGRTNTDFERALFDLYTDIDLKDPSRYAVYATQGGLGLPDRDYYLEAGFAAKKALYEKFIAELLRQEGWPEPERRAGEIIAFETAIAAASWNKTEQRDPEATYNPVSIAELEALAPGFAWRPFLAEAG